MESKKKSFSHFAFLLFQGLFLLVRKKSLELSLRKKKGVLQEAYQSIGEDLLRQYPEQYKHLSLLNSEDSQATSSLQEIQKQKQHLEELVFLQKKEEKQFRDSLNELNQKKDTLESSREQARLVLKNSKAKLKRKLEASSRQKKEFTVLTIFKGRFDSNKTIFETEKKIKEAEKLIEHAEELLSSVNQKLSNTSRQRDLLRLKLSEEIKEALKAIKEAEKEHREKNEAMLQQIAEIGRDAFEKNSEAFTAQCSQIQNLKQKIGEMESLAELYREKILESRGAMALGIVVLVLIFFAFFLLKPHFENQFSI